LPFQKRGKPETYGTVKVPRETLYSNTIDAAASGASDGMKLAINIAAMLIAFIALIEGINVLLSWSHGQIWYYTGIEKFPNSLQDIFVLFSTIRLDAGIPWNEAGKVGYLLGTQVSANEFIAYMKLAAMKTSGELSARSVALSTYALCGFSNFSSVAIQIGGISALVPEKRKGSGGDWSSDDVLRRACQLGDCCRRFDLYVTEVYEIVSANWQIKK